MKYSPGIYLGCFLDGSHVVNLNAISVGCAVLGHDFDATVHSAFREAVNLRPGSSRRLLTMLASHYADLPQGILLELPHGFSFEAELAPGERIICRNHILRDEHEQITIDFSHARRWKCRLPDLRLDKISPQVTDAFLLAWQVLDDRQLLDEAGARSAGPCGTGLHSRVITNKLIYGQVYALVEAVRQLDPSSITHAVSLIGLGSGLTPWGDDFLVGYLAGLRCRTNGHADRRAYLAELGKKVVYFSRQTNDVSRTYLYYAAHGQVSSKLAALAEAIAMGEGAGRVRQAAEDAIDVGHSSGMAAVTGLLEGLSTWGSEFQKV